MIKEGNPTLATAHVAEKDRRFRERRPANAPVAKIRVPENRLRELRDFEDLAASMDRIGLLAPITVTESGRLEREGWDTWGSEAVRMEPG